MPLLVIATAQLMLVLDDSIVNIALPSIQRELGVDAVHLPWIVNAYILAFGALLLLGGRTGDLWGRRRILQLGIALFVLASLAGGLGQNTEMLIIARAAQGVGAAMIAPNALALIATTFADRKTRDTALSLYAAMSALGIVIGLLLGGVLTDTLGWRWVFFINIPIGLLVLVGSRTLVAADADLDTYERLGLNGAIVGRALYEIGQTERAARLVVDPTAPDVVLDERPQRRTGRPASCRARVAAAGRRARRGRSRWDPGARAARSRRTTS